jgi:outer membrane protein assembly factor BamE (lipoprotein component of BamABCDE complex)
MSRMRIPVLAAAALMLFACTPVISQRGYLPDPVAEASIKAGTDTKTSVQKRLGDPSTSATFGDNAWYYITSTERQVAFFDPSTTSRKIMAIHFDKDGKVTDIKHFGLKDGHIISFETRTTPAKGRELTFLQQLFSATPGVPLSGMSGQNPGSNGP